MPVNDRHVATLRALLKGDMAEHRKLIGELGDEGMRKGYFPLLTGAFFEAVEQRFAGKARSDIINWVASTRADRDEEDVLDPDVAERLLLWVFDDASTDGIDFQVSYTHQSILLGLLVEEQQLDDDGIETLLQQARDFGDGVLERQANG